MKLVGWLNILNDASTPVCFVKLSSKYSDTMQPPEQVIVRDDLLRHMNRFLRSSVLAKIVLFAFLKALNERKHFKQIK